jgi:protein involved in polysaccharide export with SLBB domain
VEVGVIGERRRKMFVRIDGNGVRNPGIYQLKAAGEGLEELIGRAELYDDALTERMDLVRRDSDYSKSSRTLDLDEAIRQGFRLQPEDRLVVHSRHGLAGGDKQIHLSGYVKFPGDYALAKGFDLQDVLFNYGGFTDPDFRAAAHLERGDILRLDKETGEKRIIPFNLLAVLEERENQVLESGDEIVLYSADRFRDAHNVTIEGEVRLPGSYTLRQGMTLADLLVQAGGKKEEAYIGQAEVNRRSPDTANSIETAKPIETTKPIETIFVHLDQAEDFELRSHDTVFVRRIPNMGPPREVVIEGEVTFPGKYLLTEINERLSQLIERAGGLSEQAFLEGVQFTRGLKGERRSVAMDLEKLLAGRVEHDLILADGDRIHIPTKNWVVEVKGAVQLPQLVQYTPNKKAGYYVSLVGGYQPNADVNAAYIIRANRLILKASRRFRPDPEVPPGSTLMIPARTTTGTRAWRRHGPGFVGGALLSGLVALLVN